MIPYFEQLGDVVASAWAAVGRDTDLLPEIAATALSARPAREHTSMEEVLRWVATASEATFVPQADLNNTFAQPPVTVYVGRRFRIDVNYWASGSTEIHEHGFTGAFQVLHGSSLESRFAFAESRLVSASLAIGALTLSDMAVLRPGDTRLIHPGTACIHSLFHLEQPAATVVVRSLGELCYQPQRTYEPPGWAYEPTRRDGVLTPLERRRIDVALLAAGTGLPVIDDLMSDILRDGEPLFVHALVSRLATTTTTGQTLMQIERQIDAWIAQVPWRHDDVREAARAALTLKLTRRLAYSYRQVFTEVRHRLVIGVLQTAPDRATALRAIAVAAPGEEPIDVVIDFLHAGTAMRQGGNPALSLLGLSDNAAHLLEHLLREQPTIDAFFADLLTENTAEEVDAIRESLTATIHELRTVTIFAPLFR
jgi:hypothetical protein